MRHLVMLAAMICAPTHAHAQRATEQYIPVGQSPGISGILSLQGTIARVDTARRTFTVKDTTVRVDAETRIYLDRSAARLTNLRGRFRDLRPGQRVEVLFLHRDRSDLAEWVKIVVEPK